MSATTIASLSIPLDLSKRQPARSFLRLVLVGDELYAMHAPHNAIRVLSGTAYVSHHGCDVVVRAGQTQPFSVASQPALISALQGKPLVVELIENQA